MRIDHVFVFVPDGPAAEHAAITAGLVPTHRRRHHKQGTENVCFRFGGTFLELLWAYDLSELTSAPVARTGLFERSQWRTHNACPFGVCLQVDHPPFDTWPYSVPFPPGMHVLMGTTPVAEPLLFTVPTSEPITPPHEQTLGRSITAIRLAFPQRNTPTTALQSLSSTIVRTHHAVEPQLEITLDGGTRAVHIPQAMLTLRIV